MKKYSSMYYFYDDISNTEFKREGIAKYFFSFIGPVGHNIWWENVETACSDLKTV